MDTPSWPGISPGKSVAALAGHPGQEHPAGIVSNAVPPASRYESLLGVVGAPVAVGAIQFEGLLQSHDLVLDLGVAELALHVVLGDVHFVDERRVVERLHPLREVVAGPTPLLLGRPVPYDHVGVALRTGDQVPDDLFVIDGNSLVLQVRRGRMATRGNPPRVARPGDP